ncbi:MAG TPA: hypothetical protein VFX06_01530, partial [Stellaceae bacterium]|nr:hypothetical protein [Stellaceae bacterium]
MGAAERCAPVRERVKNWLHRRCTSFETRRGSVAALLTMRKSCDGIKEKPTIGAGLAGMAAEHFFDLTSHPVETVLGVLGGYGASKALMSPGFARWL